METYRHTYRHHSFSHQDLSDITFTACTFIRCDFRRANLRDATFINCKFIEQGDIEGCHFDVADLRDADRPIRSGGPVRGAPCDRVIIEPETA